MSGDNASPPTKRLCTRRIGIRERRVETESDMGRYSRTRFEPNAGLNDNRRADCPTGQPPPSVWHSRRWEIGESSDGPWDRGDVGSGCSGLAHPGRRMCSADVPAAGWGGETGIGPSVDAIDRRAPGTDPARAEGLKDAASAPVRANSTTWDAGGTSGPRSDVAREETSRDSGDRCVHQALAQESGR